MTEREAYLWWRTEQDEAGYKQLEIVEAAWQAACAYQREKDAELCDIAASRWSYG